MRPSSWFHQIQCEYAKFFRELITGLILEMSFYDLTGGECGAESYSL